MSFPLDCPVSLIGAFLLFWGFGSEHFSQSAYYKGESKAYHVMLTISSMLFSVVFLGLMIYYGWKTTWYWPIILLIAGSIIAAMLLGIIGRVFGDFCGVIVSLLGFIAWPVGAFLFYFIAQTLAN